MKKVFYRVILLIILVLISTVVTSFGDSKPYMYDYRMDKNYVAVVKPSFTLLYDNVWATVYHPMKSQCDDTPYITGDQSRINPKIINNLRWVAISQEMLYCVERQKIVEQSSPYANRSNLFKGKIQYGDTIWVSSKHPEINGWWVVHDTKNAKIRNSIDFLQNSSKKSLYGMWEDIKIYKVTNISYRSVKKTYQINS